MVLGGIECVILINGMGTAYVFTITFFYTRSRMRCDGRERNTCRYEFDSSIKYIQTYVCFSPRKYSLWYFCERKPICSPNVHQRLCLCACVCAMRCVYNIFAIIFSWAPDVRTLIETRFLLPYYFI